MTTLIEDDIHNNKLSVYRKPVSVGAFVIFVGG
jgi:hypothetical protein